MLDFIIWWSISKDANVFFQWYTSLCNMVFRFIEICAVWQQLLQVHSQIMASADIDLIENGHHNYQLEILYIQ